MLPSQYRIKRKKEFEDIFRKGQTIVGRFFIIKVVKGDEKEESRFAVVFPTKLEKRSCKRNRVKRIFREALYSNIYHIKEGLDIIFILNEKAKDKKYLEIKNEIEEFMIKNNLSK